MKRDEEHIRLKEYLVNVFFRGWTPNSAFTTEALEMARGPDEEPQAKVVMEILRMCGMYAPTKVQLDASHTHHMERLQAAEGDPKLADLIRAQEYTREMKQILLGRKVPQRF